MAMKLRSRLQGVTLNELEARRIERQLRRLDSHLEGWPEPIATLLLSQDPTRPQVAARLRVRLGHLGGHLVGRDLADTADQAVKGALAAVMRQLERRRAPGRPQRSIREELPDG